MSSTPSSSTLPGSTASHIEAFAKFLGRSTETATGDDLRRFQAQQITDGAQPPKMNSQASALRFLLIVTLGRVDLAHQLARTNYPRKLPRILTPDEVGRLVEAAPGPWLKYKAALSIAYGAGLRGGEVVMLRVSDIDSKRMLIRVEMGKGRPRRSRLRQRTATPCWHRSCLICCARGGGNRACKAGCSPARMAFVR
jgi:integrase/recombinase XerD